MNMPGKDCFHRSWIGVLTLVAVLAVVSFIPPQSIGGVKFRRACIFSDLMHFDDASDPDAQPLLFDEEEFRVDMQEVTDQIEADTIPESIQTTFEWAVAPSAAARTGCLPDTLPVAGKVFPIEDFSTDRRLEAFCDTLINARRPVRIAFLGDSFVEGDILTADLREQLQQVYGGGGAGFAPMASPLTAFRRSIKTNSKGWTAYSIMQRKAAPTAMRENFYISGWVAQASAGASTRWENSGFRSKLDSCTTARVLFISPSDSRVEVVLNNSRRQEFTIQGDPSVRQIVVSAPHIRSLDFRILSGHEGFIGYGAVFEGNGVVVDNYSIRSNNGQAMFWTNPSVNAQINAMLDYDLVVLQYGLNIMQHGVSNYANYAAQIGKMVAYVRECFPSAAVLILGVSDRAARTETGFQPMEAVPAMLSWQRRAAQSNGTAFWPTGDAMRTQGGILNFVRNGWAAKDYTHINYAGGRRVALPLYEALNAAAVKTWQENPFVRLRNHRKGRALDSLQLERLQRDLLPGFITEPTKLQFR